MITTAGRPIILEMIDATIVGEARRAAISLAGTLGFDETERGKVGIVATETATNLLKHAQSGQILIQGIEAGESAGIDILSFDKGPGMSNVDRCRKDGYSTAGSQGNGLGAMSRLSSEFDIHSLPGTGTTLMARIWPSRAPSSLEEATREVGAVNLPVAGEDVCGDSWAIKERDEKVQILLVDGLGHGFQAAEAAREAIRLFRELDFLDPADVMQATHLALKGTRGAALAIAQTDLHRGELRYVGIGNICGSVTTPGEGRSVSMVSHNGIVGHSMRKVQEFTYRWDPESLCIMHSDGLGTQWQLSAYPGLASRHPGLIAATLFRDFRRLRDDATVVVMRERAVHPA